MAKRSVLTRILAVAGTAIVWLPILAPVVLGFFSLIEDGVYRFDYLMPAELFPAALLGGGLLLWAALRARSRRRLVGWGLVGMVALLFASQGLAVLTGLASGEAEPTGWRLTLVLALLAGYALALAAVAAAGVLLVRDLFRPDGEVRRL